MSSKVVEADAKIHSLAMAVAPVTSWKLYDSIYTERYMNLPELNEGGYVNASISNVEGFKKVDYLLAHGSGDDNVHYANSAHLLDMFTREQLSNCTMAAACCSSSACHSHSASSSASSSSSCSPYSREDSVLNAMSIDFPAAQTAASTSAAATATRAQATRLARPRGLWKARGTLASKLGHASDNTTPPTPPTSITRRYHDPAAAAAPDSAPADSHSDRWHSPDPFSECEYDSDSSAASLSRHQHFNLYLNGQIFPPPPASSAKRRRRDLDSPPTSLDERDSEEIIYWDYSRKCTPNLPDSEKDWTRSKLMDTSAISGSLIGPMSPGAIEAAAAAERASTDLEDWEDLKELFAKAAEMYESQSPSETLPLLRGVIHECHRFLQMYQDPSVVYTSPLPNNRAPTPPAVDKKIINDWLLAERLHAQHQAESSKTDNSTAAPSTTTPAEKKCKCKDLPTAFYTVLGTTLFFFGNIVDASPSLCMLGEPANPVVYWLCALDAFEIGESLPVRTSGGVRNGKGDYFSSGGSGGTTSSRSAYHARAIGATPPPEDWRMAVVWGRTLVCIAEEVVRRQSERAKQGLPPRQPQNAQLSFALAPGMQLAGYAEMVPLAPTMPTSPSAFPVQQQLAAARAAEAQKEADPNMDSPVWPANSPFGAIVSRRPALPSRLSLESGVTPHELLLLAQDQFSRGILHMPHPQHLVHARFAGGSTRGSEQPRMHAAVPDSFLFTPALGPSMSYETNTRSASSHSSHSSSRNTALTSPPTTASSSSSASASTSPPSHTPITVETFSRAKELYTIAYEVLLLSEKLDLASERQTWAQWADSVFSQMKMEADTDAWRGHITAARGRCCVVIGSALAEGVEGRLERAAGTTGGDDDDAMGGGRKKRKAGDENGEGEGEKETEAEILESEDAREAREVLVEAIGYLERAKEVFEARKLEAQEQASRGGAEERQEEEEEGMIVIEDADDEDEEEDSDGIVADDSSATPTPANASRPASGSGGAASTPISHLRVPVLPSNKVSTSTQTTTTTPKNAHPPASSNPNPMTSGGPVTAEDEVEELKTLLAEALLSLANLTADVSEREKLYARAQKEGGDKFELDEWDEEDRMDESD
ncbi:hypothetical protein CVT25_002988 [Psilocybe cyanescens]|uniref:Peptidase S9 prolyl oligopeptidase catalytic domain-containing protein n=1 Tax=Psilocybe cyanescens TaxID=93625 RepID=A0A409WMV5_PSICY|nr:hypothetical protein CVT25_002988 [Psilocybe cyanescens]